MENIQLYLDRFVGNFVSGDLQMIISALIILVIGWFIAKTVQRLVKKMMSKTRWDEKILGAANAQKESSNFFAKLVYYIIMLFVLLLVLETVGLNSALGPLNNLVDQFMEAIPKIILAGIIGYLGFMLAKIVSNLVTLGGGAIDSWVDKTGFKDTNQLVGILQKVVFIIILVPFIIQALAALEMNAISEPATNLLEGFTGMIGNILVAAAVLFIFVWGGRFVKDFLQDLFVSLGFDRHAHNLGLSSMMGPDQSISKIAAGLIFFFIVFFGIITAVDILGLEELAVILNDLLYLTGQILFGLVILLIGNFISQMIYNALSKGEGNQFVANVVRWATLALFAAIALRQMGIANEIVELAFGLILGAVAVAIALAYGLGGREAAGRHFHEILDKFRK